MSSEPQSGADDRDGSRRRIWIVNHYADAPDRANGTRHFDLARRLETRGLDVTIIASGFSHVTGREERLSRGRLSRVQVFDGVRFVWVRTFPYRGNGWQRQVNMLSFLALILVVQARLPRPDTVIGSTVHPFAALGGWALARLRGASFVFEIRDLWPQTLVDLGALRTGSPGERLLRAIEAFLVRRATAVVTLLPGIRDYLVERGLPADHVRYVPNGVDLEAFDRMADSPPALPPEVVTSLAAIDRMHADGRVVFAYLGALGRVNDVATIVEATALAEGRSPGRVGLLVIGDGPERAELVRRAADVPAVEVLPAVPKRFVPVVLRAIDCGVVHATANPVYRYGISFNKLFEYFAAARPVAFACVSAYDPVRDSGAGVSLRPDDPELLADALLELATLEPAVRTRMGAAGRAHVALEHDIQQLAQSLAEIVAAEPASAVAGRPT